MHKNDAGGREWWRGTSVYQIYPRSFYDSDGDGLGDLPGIISKLDYIKATGFETVWLSPFFKSPQKDFGYDISDYYSAAPEYGTNDDIDRLIDEIHRRGMYVIFDMVLNHTSDQHPWFLESRSSKDNPRRDWYIWKDGKTGAGDRKRPPNNWKSQTGGSGWHFDEPSGQWYWAAFLPFQPDLNYRNPEVKEAIFSMLEHWLEKGVDGFRLDIIGSIFEDKDFRDSPFIWKLFPDEDNDGMLFRSNSMTQNLPESMDFVRELRALTDGFTGPPRYMVGETFGQPSKIAEFCRGGGLHSAFAFKCTSVPFTAESFRGLLKEYEQSFPEPLLPVWAFSNHDRTRRISVLGENISKAKLNAAFQITARGIPFFYFGEEIGMTDTALSHKKSLDPVSFPFKRLPGPVFNFINKKISGAVNRDPVRTPMQWNDAPNAGFCPPGAEPWLPLNSDYHRVNVERASKDRQSIYSCIEKFLKLRAESGPLRFGKLEPADEKLLPRGVLAYYRILEDGKSETERLAVFLNFSSREVFIDPLPLGVQDDMILISTDSERPDNTADATGKMPLRLSAYEAVVLG